MKYSGLYFVNNPSMNLEAAVNTVNTLVQGIENSYQTATRQTPWMLQYRLFRDTIPPGNTPAKDAEGKPKPFAHTLQHFLQLSAIDSNRAYICVQPPNGASTVTAIPYRQQEPLALLLRHQFSALWQPRQVLTIPQGTTYNAGLCTVQIGELRLTREGPQSGGIQSPGVFICISTTVDGDDPDEAQGPMDDAEDDIDFEYAQAVIRECWTRIKANRDLGKSETREVMMAPEILQKQQKEAAVRMWCEGLRLRG